MYIWLSCVHIGFAFGAVSHVGRIVPERDLMRVLRTVVQIAMLGELVDEHEKHKPEHDTLPEGVGDQIECLIVDPVQLLQALQIIQFARCVSNCPHPQVVHVAESAPSVLKGNLLTFLFHLDEFVLEVNLADVVCVLDRFTGFLQVALE